MSLVTQINALITRVGTEVKAVKTLISGNTAGTLTTLTTSDKTSLLAAINEINAGLGAVEGEVLHNKGWYATSAALIAAIPAGASGDYAIVGATDTVWIWDTDGTPQWRDGDTKGAVISVNGMTGAVTIAVATTGVDGLMSAADKTKLNDIATAATANSTDAVLKDRANHTGTQLAATISNFAATVIASVLTGLSVATATAVVAGDTILVGIGKLQGQITDNLATFTAHAGSGGAAHANAIAAGNAGFMTGADKTKLDGIAASANNYVHPTTDGNIHLPANGTTNSGKVAKATGIAGSWTLSFIDWSELTSKPTTIVGYGLTDVYSKTEVGDPTTDFVAAFNAAIL